MRFQTEIFQIASKLYPAPLCQTDTYVPKYLLPEINKWFKTAMLKRDFTLPPLTISIDLQVAVQDGRMMIVRF